MLFGCSQNNQGLASSLFSLDSAKPVSESMETSFGYGPDALQTAHSQKDLLSTSGNFWFVLERILPSSPW
jgi:hypothetical protein